ncbi:MAG: hypothetical protein AB7P33_17205 [Dehalococcoidia bacterium]
MATDEEYEVAIKDAERELAEAQTAEDIRNAWKKHSSTLGHRTLGRLLTGMSSERILTRREERGGRDT